MNIKSLLTSTIPGLFRGTGANDNAILRSYIKSIDEYNSAQDNHEMLDAIRAYNHTIVDSLNSIKPLKGLSVLDIGASPHGYALERVLSLGASEYVGIGLDIEGDFSLTTDTSTAKLAYMNAEELSFDDNQFDVIVTMSTFEHIGDLTKTLLEFNRVLRPGGCALISFEPLWTCSYGHHLHHLGAISKLVPDWGHLLWPPERMADHLSNCWPTDAPLGVEEAIEWIYHGNALNRVGITKMREILSSSAMHLEWIVPMMNEDCCETQLAAAMEETALSRTDLMTKGLSVLMYSR